MHSMYKNADEDLGALLGYQKGEHTPNWTGSWFHCGPLKCEYKVDVMYTKEHVVTSFPIGDGEVQRRLVSLKPHCDDCTATRFAIVTAVIEGLRVRNSRLKVSK